MWRVSDLGKSYYRGRWAARDASTGEVRPVSDNYRLCTQYGNTRKAAREYARLLNAREDSGVKTDEADWPYGMTEEEKTRLRGAVRVALQQNPQGLPLEAIKRQPEVREVLEFFGWTLIDYQNAAVTRACRALHNAQQVWRLARVC